MDEQFLHYVWKFQKFSSPIHTTDGKLICIFSTGHHNHDSGPDFEEARIKIEEIEWMGQIEIHVRSSNWNKHYHQEDAAYQNVILHVVWEHDADIHIKGEKIPTLELKGIVNYNLINRYQKFMDSRSDILCHAQLNKVPAIIFDNMIEKALVERLETKAEEVRLLLKGTHNNWEEVTYLILAKNMGFSVNKRAFFQLAKDTSHKILIKYHYKMGLIEALLFGQAGFLENPQDDYQLNLKKEYDYLKKKHQLTSRVTASLWKKGRMRPANSPTVRIAQFAALVSNYPQLFNFLIHLEDPKQLQKALQIEVSPYWKRHYDFGKKRKKQTGSMGASTIENLIINTLSPLLATYSLFVDNQKYMDKALQFLEVTKSETNYMTKKWEILGKSSKNAFNSQGQIALYKGYCLPKRCLHCAIGTRIIGQ